MLRISSISARPWSQRHATDQSSRMNCPPLTVALVQAGAGLDGRSPCRGRRGHGVAGGASRTDRAANIADHEVPAGPQQRAVDRPELFGQGAFTHVLSSLCINTCALFPFRRVLSVGCPWLRLGVLDPPQPSVLLRAGSLFGRARAWGSPPPQW